jgi:hypothetical protein
MTSRSSVAPSPIRFVVVLMKAPSSKVRIGSVVAFLNSPVQNEIGWPAIQGGIEPFISNRDIGTAMSWMRVFKTHALKLLASRQMDYLSSPENRRPPQLVAFFRWRAHSEFD